MEEVEKQEDEHSFDFSKFSQWHKENINKKFFSVTVKVFVDDGLCEVSSFNESPDQVMSVLLMAVNSMVPKVEKYKETTKEKILKDCYSILNQKIFSEKNGGEELTTPTKQL